MILLTASGCAHDDDEKNPQQKQCEKCIVGFPRTRFSVRQSKMVPLLHAVASLLIGVAQMPKYVAARFCEGGHICSLPRECCTQGCCPPYQSGPRQLPPPSEHVLNLFFISHWFFWCVVVAVILAILCAYSLWKKRRTLCGWGFAEHHAQSEGDSAGSCYAPPQYSRCNSFHHPPPPYTEVTSKPDLYPLVFTCNSDNGKNGSSYLMVQYFRNYIVRPAGSLSAASTVDSLSSSFICNVNEANSLVPPPYSRAASPDLAFSTHFQQQYMMPRSASQLVCSNGAQQQQQLELGSNLATQQVYQHPIRPTYYNALALTETEDGVRSSVIARESGNFRNDDSGASSRSGSCSGNNSNEHRSAGPNSGGFIQSHSDQHFRYHANSNSSISDIFLNNSCTAGIETSSSTRPNSEHTIVAHPQLGGTPVIYSNGCIKANPLHRANTNPTQFVETKRGNHPMYNSCNSIGGISITVPVEASAAGNADFPNLHVLRRSLETCCQLLQHKQQMPSGVNFVAGDSPIRINELTKKYAEEALRSYVTSGTCSGVSSLANIGTPSSPPQATSPTGEVKEILDQIRQLQEDTSYEDIMLRGRPILHHTMSTPSPTHTKYTTGAGHNAQLQRFPTMPEQQPQDSKAPTTSRERETRPSSLQHTKKKFYSPKPNKAMYIPMMANTSPLNRCILKSPVSSVVGANFFTTRGRARKSWISRSAPTTPGTGLPPNHLGDDSSPLLTEHDEDQEEEQNEHAC